MSYRENSVFAVAEGPVANGRGSFAFLELDFDSDRFVI
jgi:hypothetical protein